MNRRRVAAAIVLLCCTCDANAQPATATRVLQSFSRCKALPAPDERLACFERATDALEGEVKAKNVTILDRQDVTKARRSLFGFTIPRIALFGGGDGADRDERGDREEFNELNTTIAGTRILENGRVELRLAEENAVWVTTDPMPFPPKAGAKVRIRKGTLGNYFIAIAGERSVRGMRLR